MARKLVSNMEQTFPEAKRFEVFTGHKSKRNIETFTKLGYRKFKSEPFTPALTWVYLEKECK